MFGQQYRSVIEEGLFQIGHAKQHREGLPQIKMMLSNAADHNIPLLINTVSGNRADDGLYVPLIRQTRSVLGTSGILWQGDSKLGSLDNRYEIANHHDFYLTPASLVQIKAETLRNYVTTHKEDKGVWTDIYLDKEIKGSIEKVFMGTLQSLKAIKLLKKSSLIKITQLKELELIKLPIDPYEILLKNTKIR